MSFAVTFVSFTTVESKSLQEYLVNFSVLAHQLIFSYDMLVTADKYIYLTTIQLSEFERVYLINVISHENNHSLLGIWSLYFDGFQFFP